MNRLAWLSVLCLWTHEARGAEFPADMASPQGRISPKDLEETKRDPLVVGGKMRSSVMEFQLEDHHNDFMLNPSRVELYLDATKKGDVRFLTRGSFTYDPTINENTIDMLTGQKDKKLQGGLDELKVMFPVKKKLFFTIGKQKIRWGSAHFFNPTDFLNNTNFDPLLRDDERSGVSLLKVHAPMGRANLYLVDKLDDTQKGDQTALAGRFEFALKSSEIALSALTRKSKPSVYGADLSLAVFNADLYVESAIKTASDKVKYGPDTSQNADDASVVSYKDRRLKDFATTTAGLSYDFKYGVNHTFTLVAEYFNNPEGYSTKNDYIYPLRAGAYEPFRMGQDYAMLVLYLPKPGRLNNIELSTLNMANLTDSSYLSRFTLRSDVLGDITMEFDITRHYGESGGEMRLGTITWDYNAQLEMAF